MTPGCWGTDVVNADKPVWEREGRDWPHRSASLFVNAGGLRWHVQQIGEGPVLLCLHGAGAGTHSWRGLVPVLSRHFTMLLLDLPAHGFTATPPKAQLSMSAMAGLIGALLTTLDCRPQMVVGHSAGAALALEMALSAVCVPEVLVSLNGAFEPFHGWAGRVFPMVAKGLASNPLTVGLMARGGADPARVRRMMEGTGSRLDDEGVRLYSALFRRRGHVAGVLSMMAQWDVHALASRMGSLTVPLTLVTGLKDLAVPPRVSREVHRVVAGSTLIELPDLGHLVHEEAPQQVAALIEAAWDARPQAGM
jgi:magnesium chelatase accessory protein